MRRVLIYIVTFFVICISIWFQIGFLNTIPLAGVIANFGIVLISGLGLISGDIVGGIAGAIYGIFADVAFGRGVGFYILLYTATGIIAGLLNSKFAKEKMSMVMMTLILTIVFEVIAFMLNVIINNFEFDFNTLVTTIILEAVYNMFLAILFYKPVAFLGEKINQLEDRTGLL